MVQYVDRRDRVRRSGLWSGRRGWERGGKIWDGAGGFLAQRGATCGVS